MFASKRGSIFVIKINTKYQPVDRKAEN